MDRIILKADREEFILEDIEVKYLFAYLFRFSKIEQIDLSKSYEISLPYNGVLITFRESIHQALTDLINDCYEEPTIKKRQKHPTFFEKFIFENEKYVVDYTTSELGRLIYTLFLRLSFIDKTIEEAIDLKLVLF